MEMETLLEPPKKRTFQNCDSPDMDIMVEENMMTNYGISEANVQIFNDPIHGFIELHPLLVEIMHTSQFQRLKDIKQLGVCYWVFPGASHNRFEHCLGTAYLCGKLIDTLQELHRGQIEITNKESLCVKIAGLCHDLGHGPFSHFFDAVYIPHVIPGSDWKHEQASCDLFDWMLKSNPGLVDKVKEYCLDEGDIDFIKELILGKDPEDVVTRICPHTRKPKWFLYEIVSNKRNGIDCDKFDYFARDCANVGVTSNFDCRRYFQNVRILPIDQRLQLCVRDKEVFNIYELFHTRWSLHHRVYQHKTQAPIQDLILQAFHKVDKILRISEGIADMERFTFLTDSLMYDILRNESRHPLMVEAQELLKRMQRRELYKFCGQTQPGYEKTYPEEEKIVTELTLISEGSLKKEQIFVAIVNIHFGMKHKDPIDNVVFFNKAYQPFTVRKEQVSQILPQKFHERYVRVYAKSREDSTLIQQCFEKWCYRNNYPVPHMLQGDRTGYFSPAFKLNNGPGNRAVDLEGACKSQRSLESEFEKC